MNLIELFCNFILFVSISFRMREKSRATRAWYRRRLAWSPSAEYRCERDAPFADIWPRFTRCIGAVTPGIKRNPMILKQFIQGTIYVAKIFLLFYVLFFLSNWNFANIRNWISFYFLVYIEELELYERFKEK